MSTTSTFFQIVPVLPTANVERDVQWYQEKTGFQPVYTDAMYAVLNRDNLYLHLQWHADTDDDPLLGGSVIRILVKEVEPIFAEFVARGTVADDALRLDTPWQTHEFGFYDLNDNAVFIVQDAR